MGTHIDNHSCVFRVNHAPSTAYEQHVGARTTHRVIGPAMLRMFENMYKMTGALATCNGCEPVPSQSLRHSSNMCFNETCIFGHKTRHTVMKDSVLVGRRPANRSILTLSVRYTKHVFDWIQTATGAPETTAVSGGLFALMIATSLTTGKLDAYGFETGKLTCCHEFERLEAAALGNTSNSSGYQLQYKYYEPAGKWSHERCCQGNWLESFDEFEPMRRLSENGINFHLSSIKAGRSSGTASNKPASAPPPLEIVLIPAGSTHRDLWDPAWAGLHAGKLSQAQLSVLRRTPGSNPTNSKWQNAALKRLRRQQTTSAPNSLKRLRRQQTSAPNFGARRAQKNQTTGQRVEGFLIESDAAEVHVHRVDMRRAEVVLGTSGTSAKNSCGAVTN
eukprot:6214239-Pleurochrysis_carterae.AAC.1